MTAFAYFRLPYQHHATLMKQTQGKPLVLSSVNELNGKRGFVIAPFAVSEECPVLLMQPDVVEVVEVMEERGERKEKRGGCRDERGERKEEYSSNFATFHAALEERRFEKIVLARCAQGTLHDASLRNLFFRTCQRYPRLFVSLVHTEQSGTWLMATPEVLLEGNSGTFTTMALAGTQQAEPTSLVSDAPVEGVMWSEKNREEQQYVADYLHQTLQEFSADITTKGPYTTMAANLYHLRTDFQFRLSDAQRLGDVLERLYPTPAVCGIPKDEARQFILDHEHTSRKYYSGFVGTLSPEGDTHLYVSLRCMHVLDGGVCYLYAGGGLLRESVMQTEWEETEAKLNTMRNVL